MREDVKNYIMQCDGYQMREQGHEYRAPMGRVRVSSSPFEIVNMDCAVLYLKPDLEIGFC
jgi:hypothetical protein